MAQPSMKYRLEAYDAKIQTLLDDEREGLISQEEFFEAFAKEVHPLIGKPLAQFNAQDAEIWSDYHKKKTEEQIAHTDALFG